MAGAVVSRTTPTVILASSVLLREGTSSLLRGTPYKVVAAVAGPTELTDRDVTKEDRALAIVGIDSESPDQVAKTIHQLRSLMPNGKIVLVAEANRPADNQLVLALAPDAYILIPDSQDILVKSLELTLAGQQTLVMSRPTGALTNGRDDPQFPGRAVGSQSSSEKKTVVTQLSPRERQVLTCLAHGESNKEIARTCGISDATVKVHLKAILRKTHRQNRTQAAIWAIEHGLQGSVLRATTEPPSLSSPKP